MITFRCPRIDESISCPKSAGESKRGAGSVHAGLEGDALGGWRNIGLEPRGRRQSTQDYISKYTIRAGIYL